MRDRLIKIIHYFKRNYNYWSLTDNSPINIQLKGPLRHYPLSIKQRISEGHYTHFDEDGIPVRIENNKRVYRYSTICSYALTHWELYLESGNPEFAKKLVKIADFLSESAQTDPYGAALLSHEGRLCALNQGQAISVLCRAWQYTGQKYYLAIAERCLIPFQYKIEDGGVVGEISKINCSWYEEYTKLPLNHVLNGKVYSLLGIYDLWEVTKKNSVKKILDEGCLSMQKALPLFDAGYWSYYDIAEDGRNYVASMMYHNLHICQLQILYKLTNNEEFKKSADLFKKYSDSYLNRFRAAWAIAFAKARHMRS